MNNDLGKDKKKNNEAELRRLREQKERDKLKNLEKKVTTKLKG